MSAFDFYAVAQSHLILPILAIYAVSCGVLVFLFRTAQTLPPELDDEYWQLRQEVFDDE